jgi:hypothetical protein
MAAPDGGWYGGWYGVSMMFARSAYALVLSLALTSAASSQELIRNDAANADPQPAAAAHVSDDQAQADAEANGAWARAVMDKAADNKKIASGKPGCVRNPDRAPHGEVWAGVGTRGYNDIGGVVTQPLGDCSTVTLGYEQSHGDEGYGRGRRGR